MVERGGRVDFASIHQKTVFATSADAICMASAPHTAFERKPHVKAPDKGCQCGYYSVTDVTELPIRASVSCSSHLVYLLEVNVSGVIIPAHAGYRAEHQEVIRVWLPVKCAQCNATPTGLAAIDGFGADMVRDKARDRGLVPVCKLHAQDADAFYNIGDLRDLFATDFEWLNPAV